MSQERYSARTDPAHMSLDALTLIEASAGTGKTYTITTLVLRLLVEQGLHIREILIVTFTRAATTELRDRVRVRIRQMLHLLERDSCDDELVRRWRRDLADQGGLRLAAQRLNTALQFFDEAAILTIHGFCHRVLVDDVLLAHMDLDVQLDSDCSDLLDDLAHDFWSQQLANLPPALVDLLAARYSKHDGVTLEVLGAVARVATEQPDMPIFPQARVAIESDANALQDKKVQEQQLAGLLLDMVGQARQQMPLRKQRAGVLSYADLLNRLDQALQGPSGASLAASIRAQYRAALIDEFQDTDPRQYQIFHAIYGGQNQALVLIGDPKQAIYAFRGADVYAYLDAARDVGERRYTLECNYRSDPNLVQAINQLFRRLPWSFVLDDLRFEPVAARHAQSRLRGSSGAGLQIQWIEVDGEGIDKRNGFAKSSWMDRHLPDWVATDMTARLNSGQCIVSLDERGDAGPDHPLRPGDMAVLCATNKQARACLQALRERGVPAVFLGESSVLDSDEAVFLQRVLRAIVDEGRAGSLQAALATPLLGLNAQELDELMRDNAAMSHWIACFRQFRRRWQQAGLAAAMRLLFDEHGVVVRVLSQPEGARRLGDLTHLIELLQMLEQERNLQPAALSELFAQLCQRQDLRERHLGEAHQQRFDGSGGAVTVLTMHKSKGLEFGVVYCPYLYSGALRVNRDKRYCVVHDEQGRASLNLAPDKVTLQSLERERLAEKLRLVYVALTRAKHQCVVYWSAFKASELGLGFLLHADPTHDSAEAAWAALKVRCKSKDKDGQRRRQMRQEMECLAQESGGVIECLALDAPARVSYRPPPLSSDVAPRVRRLGRALPSGFRVTSFSALTAAAPHSAHEPISDRDFDAAVHRPESNPSSGISAPLAFSGMRAGAALGRFVHAVLEQLDFASCTPDVVRALCQHELDRSSLTAPDLTQLVQDFCSIVDTPLLVEPQGGAGFRLRDLGEGDKRVELEFTLPVASDSVEAQALRLDHLAACFAQHAAHPAVHVYAEQMRELQAPPLQGFVRGFIDLVCRVDGRYYLVDYKSNWLGDTVHNYGGSALAQAMVQNHYVLQYHLYLLALRRFLMLRIPDFDDERDLGGVLYLFVRGMSPAHPEGSGIYFDRPPPALLQALDAALVSSPAGRSS